MSNNSFVTLNQREIARAQVVQAEAARVEPTVDMNPILLRPMNDVLAQVIVLGQTIGNRSANDYFTDMSPFATVAKRSLDRLKSEFDLVVIEGAGSCAEVNLRDRDFVNFEIARHAEAPVILVADIDRGGVFAQVVGTMEVLSQADRARIKGILINRFRGDARLFESGIRYLEERTGVPVMGLIPHFSDIHIDSEDGLPMTAQVDPPTETHADQVRIAVILLPHISNFTDFLPLEIPGQTQLHYLRRLRSLSGYDFVLIPGTKNVRQDLQWLHDSGWSRNLIRFRQDGGTIGGICGGYQILGEKVNDPHGVEGDPGATSGLGLLPVETVLERSKRLSRTEAVWSPLNLETTGYEIHHGVTTPTKPCEPLLEILSRDRQETPDSDGAVTPDGKVWGCYLHGLFDRPRFRAAFLRSISGKSGAHHPMPAASQYDFRQKQYDLLAEHFRRHIDMEFLKSLVPGSAPG